VIAPDLPGFGFTHVPDGREYSYTFDGLGQTISSFTDELRLERFALYIFDYGAPSGLRVAMANPSRVAAIISQNGNAYEDGLGDAWDPIQRYWRDPTSENREALRGILTLEGIRFQYTHGVPDADAVDPLGYTLDAALLARPGNDEIQLDLIYDYRNNVKL
jgi:pimeloyl-ACP methyl ester carboxylesterase